MCFCIVRVLKGERRKWWGDEEVKFEIITAVQKKQENKIMVY